MSAEGPTLADIGGCWHDRTVYEVDQWLVKAWRAAREAETLIEAHGARVGEDRFEEALEGAAEGEARLASARTALQEAVNERRAEG